MAHQGRCSARRAAVLATALLVISLLLHLEVTEAAKYTVGDTSGWTFSVNSWTTGKTFKAGDILTFKYNPQLHNVVMVDADGYSNCTASASSKTYTSGSDRVKLLKGPNYFICSIPGHCNLGVKLVADAS